jgi:UDP-GlcNAc:undecaprenyl-phosphate GlcNAc-1-phosphate transferase
VEVAVELAVLFGVCLLISGVVIRLSVGLAARFGIMDCPGGHKQHAASTPFVGGFGLIAVLIGAALLGDPIFSEIPFLPLAAILVGSVTIFLTGLADDIWHLSFKPRLAIQALVALSMVFLGGVELDSLGELLPGLHLNLGWLGVPLTIFATIGLINAVNMIDGVDGLSGSVSMVSLALIALVAYAGNAGGYVIFIVALMGGVGGFLYYNLRYPGNSRARVFLGDNGSMLLGFLFAWLLIALSQGSHAAMTPVTALWLFALPLMDTVGVMLRRIWLGKSPFRPDRHHLHHLFIRAGFRVCDVVLVATVMQIVLGLVGVVGLLLDVPDYLMFGLFLAVFAVYFLLILRPWRLVPGLCRLNRSLGLPSVHIRGLFVGSLRKEQWPEILRLIAAELGTAYAYQFNVYQLGESTLDGRNVYCVVHVPAEGNDLLIGRIRRDAMRIRRRLARQQGLAVRLFVCRDVENELGDELMARDGSRSADRRGVRRTLIYSAEHGQKLVHGDDGNFELSVPPACR